MMPAAHAPGQEPHTDDPQTMESPMAAPPRPAPPPGPPPASAAHHGTPRAGQTLPGAMQPSGARTLQSPMAPVPPAGLPPPGTAKVAAPLSGAPRSRPPAVTAISSADSSSPSPARSPTPPAGAPPPHLVTPTNASAPVPNMSAAAASGPATDEPNDILGALRGVAEPLCAIMQKKQADDTRKKLLTLEASLKGGAVGMDMRKLVASLLRHLAAADRQEAERTQRAIAQMAFDAGDNSPPWVQATSRLVLQLKAGGVARGAGMGTASAAGRENSVGASLGGTTSGMSTLSHPSTPSSAAGSAFSSVSSFAAPSSQPATPLMHPAPDFHAAPAFASGSAPDAGGGVHVGAGSQGHQHSAPQMFQPAAPATQAAQPAEASMAPLKHVPVPDRFEDMAQAEPSCPPLQVPGAGSRMMATPHAAATPPPPADESSVVGATAQYSAPPSTILGAPDAFAAGSELRKRAVGAANPVAAQASDAADESKSRGKGSGSGGGAASSRRSSHRGGCVSCVVKFWVFTMVILVSMWVGWIVVCETPATWDAGGGAPAAPAPTSLSTLLSANSLSQYTGALADKGVTLISQLAQVTDEDIRDLGMKPIHANKLRHLRDKHVSAAASPAEGGVREGQPHESREEPAHHAPKPPAVCGHASEAGTAMVRALGAHLGDENIARVLGVLMGVHARATGPEAAHLRAAATHMLQRGRTAAAGMARAAVERAADLAESVGPVSLPASLPTTLSSPLPLPDLAVSVADIELPEATGFGWLCLKALLVVCQVLTYPLWVALEGCTSALALARRELFALWSQHVMLL